MCDAGGKIIVAADLSLVKEKDQWKIEKAKVYDAESWFVEVK